VLIETKLAIPNPTTLAMYKMAHAMRIRIITMGATLANAKKQVARPKKIVRHSKTRSATKAE